MLLLFGESEEGEFLSIQKESRRDTGKESGTRVYRVGIVACEMPRVSWSLAIRNQACEVRVRAAVGERSRIVRGPSE